MAPSRQTDHLDRTLLTNPRRAIDLVGESGPHVGDAPPQPIGINMREVVDQGALHLDDGDTNRHQS